MAETLELDGTKMTAHRPHSARRLRIAAIALIVLAMAHGQVRAQSGSAEALYTEGHRLLEDGKLEEACEAFEASNRAQPGAGTYLALGMCRERSGQIASAWSAYQAALARAKDEAKRRFARTKIDELEPKLSYLTVWVSADNAEGMTLTRNGILHDRMLWNRALPVDGGDYLIEGHVPGRETWRTTVHVPTERGAVTAVVPDLEKHTRPVSPPEVRWSARRKVSAGLAVTSVVAVGVGTWLGLTARNYENRAHEVCPNPLPRGCEDSNTGNGLLGSAGTFTTAANVTFGIAGASAITAGILWFTGDRTRSTIAVVPTASAQGFAVTATRTF
jgi:tetratricopeptide (TPR) repeat protein